MPEPKVKHDWYQTETTVVVEVRLKGCTQDKVKADFGSGRNLSVTAPIPGSSSEYSLELDLAHPVVPEQCSVRVLSTKIEVRLQKAEGIRWASLEGDGSDPLKPAASASEGAKAAAATTTTTTTTGGAGAPKYPSSTGKDWNRIGAEIEKTLEEDKLEGEQALNSMFQKIYAEGSDDLKRAMNKSFSESGGTVLSTNWDEIKKDKVDVKPPDGMEFKKWD